MTRASVIIPNWNGAHLLPACLDSLRRQTLTDFETIVVDNASTDESRTLIATRYPEVRLLAMEENLFFAGGCNRAIELARGDFIVLLNNDTETEPDWLEALIAPFADDPFAGMTTSKLLLYDKRTHLHSTGDLFFTDGMPNSRGVWEEDRGQYDADTAVFSACGAAAAYRREMLEDVGLFDEQFVGYCEDVDLAFRAQLRGWRCVYAPKARVYHHLSATGGGPRSSYLVGKNAINVLVKNAPQAMLRRFGGQIVQRQVAIALAGVRGARHASSRARLRGMAGAIADFAAMYGKRKGIQQRRLLSDSDLFSRLARA